MITTCPKCNKLYEERSEEEANRPDRMCDDCWLRRKCGRLPDGSYECDCGRCGETAK